MKRKLLSILLGLCMSFTPCFALSACTNSIDADLVIWFGGSIIGEDEPEIPQEDWAITKLKDRFEEQTGKKVKMTYFEDEEAMVLLVANNVRKGNEIPDVVCLYSSEALRDMSDTVYSLKDYITEEEANNILFWETVTDNASSNVNECSEVYGYPFGGTEVTFIAYNKSLFDVAEIDIENNTPKNLEELFEICAKLKSHNILPFVASDGGWNELYQQVFSKAWIQMSGDQKIIDLGKGIGSFSGDYNLINSLTIAHEAYSNGYINPDYATNDDAVSMFINGQGAMFSCSNYDLNLLQNSLGDDLGVFILPDFSENINYYPGLSFGGCNQALCIPRGANDKDLAMEFIHFACNKQNTIELAKSFNCFPNRNDIELDDYLEVSNPIIEEIYPLLPYAHYTPDYLLPMDVNAEFCRYTTAILIGELSVQEGLNRLDNFVNEK